MLGDIQSLHLSVMTIALPFVFGMGVGGLCVAAIRGFRRRELPPPPPPPAPKKEHEFDPFVNGSPSEQRHAHRRSGNPTEVLLAKEKDSTPSWRAWVLDRSVGGMCLGIHEEIPEGSLVRALPANAPPLTPWTELEVRSCRATNDGFEVGCQFVRQPPWAVLLLFG